MNSIAKTQQTRAKINRLDFDIFYNVHPNHLKTPLTPAVAELGPIQTLLVFYVTFINFRCGCSIQKVMIDEQKLFQTVIIKVKN